MSNTLQLARETLSALLSPAAKEHGLSLKAMPDDMSAGVIRTAMVIPFVTEAVLDSTSTSASGGDRITGFQNVKAHVLVLAASQVGSRGAEWACEIVTKALHGVRTGRGTAWPDLVTTTVLVKGTSYTSFKSGIWQYRVEVDLQITYTSDNLSAKQDIALAAKLATITW